MASGPVPIRPSGSRSDLLAAAAGDAAAAAAATAGGAAAGSGAPPAVAGAGAVSAVAATDEGLAMLRELQGHNALLRRELLGAGRAIDRLAATVR